MSGTRYANALLNPQTDPGPPQLTARQRAAYMRSLMSPPLDIGPRWNTPEENAQASADLANLRKLWGPSLPTQENQPGPDPNLAKGPLQRLHWPTSEEVKQALSTLPPMFLGSTSPIGLAPKFGVMDFPKGLSASFVSPTWVLMPPTPPASGPGRTGPSRP